MNKNALLNLYKQGKVSAGYAANLLGLDRYEFNEPLAGHRISPFNYAQKEFEKESRLVKRFSHRFPKRASTLETDKEGRLTT